MGPVGQADMGDQVDSLASLQVGLEAQEGSVGASLEVLEVGHLVDLKEGHLVGLGVDSQVGQKGGYLEVQVVGSYHLGGRMWPWGRVVDQIGTEVLAEIKYQGRLVGHDLRLPMERCTSRQCFN